MVPADEDRLWPFDHEEDMGENERENSDQDMEPGDDLEPIKSAMPSRPAVREVVSHFQQMEIDDFEVPRQPEVLVPGKFGLFEQ